MSPEDRTALVFDIARLSTHDGPGLRGTVFLKGCPLRCLWCHNPESWSRRPELFFAPEKCIGCGRCQAVCPRHCHTREPDHCLHRQACTGCGRCAAVCPAGALQLAGKVMSAGEVIATIRSDQSFYQVSGGGLTVSGGEPLLAFDFTLALAQLAQQQKIAVAVDTCGEAAADQIDRIFPYVNDWLYDIKTLDPLRHRQLTGRDNRRILSNLTLLDRRGGRIFLRYPLIPGVNDAADDLARLADLVKTLHAPLELTIHPYHPLGLDKYRRLGIDCRFACKDFLPPETVGQWCDALNQLIPTKIGGAGTAKPA